MGLCLKECISLSPHVEAVRTRDRHGSVPKHLKLKKAYRVETPGSNVAILGHFLGGWFGMFSM